MLLASAPALPSCPAKTASWRLARPSESCLLSRVRCGASPFRRLLGAADALALQGGYCALCFFIGAPRAKKFAFAVSKRFTIRSLAS